MTIPERLKSRKFWITVGGFITLIASGESAKAVALLIAYLGMQGAQDTVTARRGRSIDSAVFDEEDEVDTNNIVSGKDMDL